MSHRLHNNHPLRGGVNIVPEVVSEYKSQRWFIENQNKDFLPTVPNPGDNKFFVDPKTGTSLFIYNVPWAGQASQIHQWSLDVDSFPDDCWSVSHGVTVVFNNTGHNFASDSDEFVITYLPSVDLKFRLTQAFDHDDKHDRILLTVNNGFSQKPDFRISACVFMWMMSPYELGRDVDAISTSIKSIISEITAHDTDIQQIYSKINTINATIQAMVKDIVGKVDKSFLRVKKLKVLLDDSKKRKEKRRRSRRIKENLLKLLDTDEEITKATKVLHLL